MYHGCTIATNLFIDLLMGKCCRICGFKSKSIYLQCESNRETIWTLEFEYSKTVVLPSFYYFSRCLQTICADNNFVDFEDDLSDQELFDSSKFRSRILVNQCWHVRTFTREICFKIIGNNFYISFIFILHDWKWKILCSNFFLILQNISISKFEYSELW